jgi:hypothetical protein
VLFVRVRIALKLGPTSISRYLHEHCHRLFADEMFADLFEDIGREWIPPQIVAVVMVLQRLEGLSDREAVERFAYDLRWKYAAGGLSFDHGGFVHTVLVRMRAKLQRSARPGRIFEVALEAARGAPGQRAPGDRGGAGYREHGGRAISDCPAGSPRIA